MRTTRRVTLWLAIAALALALVAGGCATAPKVERYVPPSLGSTFTFSRSNTGSFRSGTEKATWTVAERTWEGKRMTALGIPGGVGLFNADGNQVAVLGPDDKPILSYDPPIGYDYPLEVGKTSTKSYRVTVHATKQTMPFDWTWKVEAYGDVTVPAGTFKAFIPKYPALGKAHVQVATAVDDGVREKTPEIKAWEAMTVAIAERPTMG